MLQNIPGVLNTLPIAPASPGIDVRLSRIARTKLVTEPTLVRSKYAVQAPWDAQVIIGALDTTLGQAAQAAIRMAPPEVTRKALTQAVSAIRQLARAVEVQTASWPKALWAEDRVTDAVGWRVKFMRTEFALVNVQAAASQLLRAQGNLGGSFPTEMRKALDRLEDATGRLNERIGAALEPLGGVKGAPWVASAAIALLDGDVVGAAALAGFPIPDGSALEAGRSVPQSFMSELRALKTVVEGSEKLPKDLGLVMTKGLGLLLEELERRNDGLKLKNGAD